MQTISNKAVMVAKGTEVIVVGVDKSTNLRHPVKVKLEQDVFLDTDGKPFQVSESKGLSNFFFGWVIGVVSAVLVVINFV